MIDILIFNMKNNFKINFPSHYEQWTTAHEGKLKYILSFSQLEMGQLA